MAHHEDVGRHVAGPGLEVLGVVGLVSQRAQREEQGVHRQQPHPERCEPSMAVAALGRRRHHFAMVERRRHTGAGAAPRPGPASVRRVRSPCCPHAAWMHHWETPGLWRGFGFRSDRTAARWSALARRCASRSARQSSHSAGRLPVCSPHVWHVMTPPAQPCERHCSERARTPRTTGRNRRRGSRGACAGAERRARRHGLGWWRDWGVPLCGTRQSPFPADWGTGESPFLRRE